MAAFVRGSSNPEISRPASRYRRHQYVRPESTSRSRRPYIDDRQHPSRSSPTRQTNPLPYPFQYTPSTSPWTSPYLTPTASSNHSPPELSNGIVMERTPSGNSIISDIPNSPPLAVDHTLCSRDRDLQAARRVEAHLRRLPKSCSNHERILRNLIHSHHDRPLDDLALDGILTAADTVFFENTLSGRVQWEWSSHDRYRTELIGTTALRPRSNGDGFETLIVLSEPILRNPSYDQRLLLSAFLHELIHCYLFIECGFDARAEGGHTTGFHRVAELMDNWVGVGYLSLCKLKEDPLRWHKGGSLGESIGEDWRARDPQMEEHRGRPIYVSRPKHGHDGFEQSLRHRSSTWDPGAIPVEYF